MSDDLRVKVDFPSHFKTKKLIALEGGDGVVGLLKLWVYTRVNRPKGDLYGLADIDIDIICDIDSKRLRNAYDSFAACLADIGFLDKDEAGYTLHDWATHQPYAFYADERSEKARQSAQVRWGKKTDKSQSDAEGMPDGSERNTEGTAPFPFPSPIPKRKKSALSKKLTDEEFWASLQANPAYAGISFTIEDGKMDAWLLAHEGRKKTRKFIVNWLNSAVDKLAEAVTTPAPGRKQTPTEEAAEKELNARILARKQEEANTPKEETCF